MTGKPLLLFVFGTGILLVIAAGLKSHDGNKNDSATSHAANSIVTDIDGNAYHTVKIGNQVWMVENLKTTRYRDGSRIANIVADHSWSVSTSGAYCWYENDTSFRQGVYGALYNYYAVADRRNLCPEGWHVPSKSEWLALEAYLGGRAMAGGKMKETGSAHWHAPNIAASNECGFSGIPGGGRAQLGWFGEIGEYATWWSSSAEDSDYAWHWGVSRVSIAAKANPGHKASGFSVRCLRD